MSDRSPEQEQAARIDVLNAFLANKNKNSAGALEILKGGDDPIRFRARLSTLVQNDEFSDAFELIKGRVFHERWGEVAVYACVASGNERIAVELIDSARVKVEPKEIDKFRAAFGEAVLNERLKSSVNPTFAEFRTLSFEDTEILELTTEVLSPIVEKIRINEKIESKWQKHALDSMASCLGLLGRLTELDSLLTPLMRYKPIPLLLPQLALARVLNFVPDDLIARTRTEHPTNFSAQLLAARCEHELNGNSKRAFQILERLGDEWGTFRDADAGMFCPLVFEVAAAIGGKTIDEAKSLVEPVEEPGANYGEYFKALRLLDSKSAGSALTTLMESMHEDQTLWWQLVSKCHQKLNDFENAAEAMSRACKLMPHPSLLNHYARISAAQSDLTSAIDALELAYAKSPNDIDTLTNLGFTCIRARDHRRAAECFAQLADLQLDEPKHRLNQAICLARSNQIDIAVKVLDDIPEPNASNLQTVLTRCQILSSSGKSEIAMDLLRDKRDAFWNEAAFVAVFMDTAYRSGKDHLAGPAMHQLLELQKAGSSETEWLVAHSLDEIVEFGDKRKQNIDEISEMVADCKMPWLYADAMLGVSAMRSWYSRTSEHGWISEEKAVRGNATVYASNAFGVHTLATNVSEIMRIKRPEKGKDVVADLSALLTLFKLGRLDEATKFFRTIYIPGSIEELNLREATTTAPHQPSRQEELEGIRELVDKGVVNIDHDESAIQYLDEYADDDSTAFTIENLHNALAGTQKVTTENLESLHRLAKHKKNSTAKINLEDRIAVNLMSLGLLVKQSWFEGLARSLKFVLWEREYDNLVSQIRGHEFSRIVFTDHELFWNEMRKKSNSIKSVPFNCDQDEPDDESVRSIPHLDPSRISLEKNLDLLADDRVCQQYKFSDSKNGTSTFGTDGLLTEMWKSEQISLEQATDDFQKMVSWRYRFLLPEPEYLKNLADRSKSNLPGPALILIAQYLHDCMQDPGLLCGFENTEPPIPLGFKLNYKWISLSIDFIVLIANDENYQDESLNVLVPWIVKSLMASTPNRMLHLPVGKNMTASFPRMLIQLLLIALITIDSKRANQILMVVCKALGVDETMFLKISAEAASERQI